MAQDRVLITEKKLKLKGSHVSQLKSIEPCVVSMGERLRSYDQKSKGELMKLSENYPKFKEKRAQHLREQAYRIGNVSSLKFYTAAALFILLMLYIVINMELAK